MKKIIIALTLITLTIITLTGCKTTSKGTLICAYTTYTREAMITNREGDEVIARDMSGNEWAFYIDENDNIDSSIWIDLIMCDNGTEEIEDDEVIDYIYRR